MEVSMNDHPEIILGIFAILAVALIILPIIVSHIRGKKDMPDERPSQQELPRRSAGVAEAKHVRLSVNPTDHYTAPRTEAGPEALPSATIHGPFRPINDRGPETAVTPKGRHEPLDATDLVEEEEL